MGIREDLGKEIANKRRRAGMSQDDLRKAIGLSRNTVGLYERGARPIPFETLAEIAAAVSVDEFVVDGLHITISRNGAKAVPQAAPQQLELTFDNQNGGTVRIEPTKLGLVIKKISA